MAQQPAAAQAAAQGQGPALHAVLNQIQTGLHDFQNDRVHRLHKESVQEQIRRTRECDGSLAADVREWVAEIELCVPLLGQVQGAVLEVAAGTARGPLRKEFERFVGNQVQLQGPGGGGRPAVPWQAVRDHLRTVFLSQNEGERLRAEVETMTMNSFDTVASYNLKFREAAVAAYPQPRSADAERTLVHAYIRSLSKYEMKKKVIENHPANLDAAMHRAEQVDADHDQCRRLIGDRREEPMEVNTVASAPALAALQKQLAQLTTNVGKLSTMQKTQNRSERKERKSSKAWTADGLPICYECQRAGHFARDCFRRKGQGRKDPRPPQQNQGN